MTDERHVLVIFPHPDDETFRLLELSQVTLKKVFLSHMHVSP